MTTEHLPRWGKRLGSKWHQPDGGDAKPTTSARGAVGFGSRDCQLERALHTLFNHFANFTYDLPPFGDDDNRWLARIAAGISDQQLGAIPTIGPHYDRRTSRRERQLVLGVSLMFVGLCIGVAMAIALEYLSPPL